MSTPHAIDPFTSRSLMWCIASIVLGIGNYVSDILVATALATEGESDWWFILTVIFVIVPLIIVNMFSIFWFHQDHIKFRKYAAKNLITERPKGGIFLPLTHAFTERERKTIMVSHFFGLGPILR